MISYKSLSIHFFFVINFVDIVDFSLSNYLVYIFGYFLSTDVESYGKFSSMLQFLVFLISLSTGYDIDCICSCRCTINHLLTILLFFLQQDTFFDLSNKIFD
jgi:hypothetical protein